MLKINIPKKLMNEFYRTGIIAFGEIHGIKENTIFYEKFIEQLPVKPNLAIEMFSLEIIEFKKFLSNQCIDKSVFSKDGRINLEYLNFLKKYILENRTVEIIYLDESYKKGDKTRDEQMANYFLEYYKKPTIIIAGNLHTSKEIFKFNDYTHIPMGYYLKKQIGDFPYISLIPASGNHFNFEITKLNDIKNVKINEIIEKNSYNYKYYFEKANPTTQL